MGVWEIVVGALVLVLSIVMIILIILQEGHQAGLGTVTGGADSFLSRGKARTADAIFARITRYCAIVFFLLVVGLNAIAFFGGNDNKSSASQDANISSSSKAETADQAESKTEASKAEASKAEASKAEASKAEASKTEASKAEASKTEASKAEASKTESSKTEASKAEASANS